MSTKSSISYTSTDNHMLHIYHECMDDEPVQPVYIEVWNRGEVKNETVDLVLSPQQAFDIYLSVRKEVEHAESCARETDDAIAARSADAVRERIERNEQWKAMGSPKGSPVGLLAHAGFMGYGSPDDPPDVQIAAGIDSAKKYRDQCGTQLEELRKAKP